MQLTNAEVLNALQGLNKLAGNKLPIKLSWKVATASRELEAFAKAVDTPMQEVRTKHALKDENGNFVEAFDENGVKVPNTIQIPGDKVALVNSELNELLSEKVEVHNVQLNLSDFPETLELEPAIVNALMPILTDK